MSMAPAEVKREGDDYDIPNEADDIRLTNESRAEPDHGCEAGPSNEEATNMNVEDGGADVKKEMVDDAHRNDMVGDVERAILEQKFDSVEDGEDFYNAYAKAKGFSIRKSRFNTNKEGKVVSRLWLCSREGQRLPKYLDCVAEKSRAPKALTRVGCKVQFRIRYDADAGEGGKYVVTHFIVDHNHELAEQHCVMYLRSHRSLNSADKAQAMAMRNVDVKTSQIMDYMVNQSGSYENVGFIRTDLHNHIQAERKAEVEDGDAQGALVYLCAKLDVDARFFLQAQVKLLCGSIHGNDRAVTELHEVVAELADHGVWEFYSYKGQNVCRERGHEQQPQLTFYIVTSVHSSKEVFIHFRHLNQYHNCLIFFLNLSTLNYCFVVVDIGPP
ncbi:protein FAR1-RELATED SEQUENCE 5-like [Camellia sinensis]|uniref:protein FAR1-RELATED SEQUENCE 5-like n=1 Tax=Camellia sinensis TaxID=4442 RepID=UPI001036378B|nr:protein FAR1-RELATED SEQUENCE 5-like [Camellia sinensis]